jgi:hypothetical protein
MKVRAMDVLRYDITDLVDFDLYLAPGMFETETVVTVICGEISGELDRVVSRDEDGGLVIVYEARIDGLGDGAGVAKVVCNSTELSCLASVSAFLAAAVDELTARDQMAV